MAHRSGRLDVGVIGGGKVGTVLAAALAGAGHRIVGISAISEQNQERASAILPEVRFLDDATIISSSELVVIAVPEQQLPGLVQGVDAAELWQPGQILVHTVAKYGVEVLAGAKGTIPIAIHPALDFTGTSIDLVRLRESVFAVTAPTPVLPIAQALVLEMGAEPVVIEQDKRPVYAEAISVASEFSQSIIDQSSELLRNIGVEDPASVLRSVALSSVQNALARSKWTQSPVRAPQEEE